MCSLCQLLVNADHWTNFHPDSASHDTAPTVTFEGHLFSRATRLSTRSRKASLATALLSPWRLRVRDWEGTAFFLQSPTGRCEVAANLSHLWQLADTVFGASPDPLDPAYLVNLRTSLHNSRKAGQW